MDSSVSLTFAFPSRYLNNSPLSIFVESSALISSSVRMLLPLYLNFNSLLSLWIEDLTERFICFSTMKLRLATVSIHFSISIWLPFINNFSFLLFCSYSEISTKNYNCSYVFEVSKIVVFYVRFPLIFWTLSV